MCSATAVSSIIPSAAAHGRAAAAAAATSCSGALSATGTTSSSAAPAGGTCSTNYTGGTGSQSAAAASRITAGRLLQSVRRRHVREFPGCSHLRPSQRSGLFMRWLLQRRSAAPVGTDTRHATTPIAAAAVHTTAPGASSATSATGERLQFDDCRRGGTVGRCGPHRLACHCNVLVPLRRSGEGPNRCAAGFGEARCAAADR